MKKVLVLAAVLVLTATASFAAITDTAHDLSTGSAATITGTYDRVCAYCHTPHGAGAVGTAPLWNRAAGAAITTAYGNPAGTMDATADLAAANGSDAPLCLSCHDGASLTNALVNPPNVAGAVPAVQVGAAANIGTALDNDHPIGFSYDAALVAADGELDTSANVEASAGMAGALSYGGTGDQMWCSSCHDVHGVTGTSAFLRINNTTSALCFECHLK